jgi:hypothetical protein
MIPSLPINDISQAYSRWLATRHGQARIRLLNFADNCTAITSRYFPTRFRALALFGRRPAERVLRSVLPAAENLHKRRPEQVQQTPQLLDHLAGFRPSLTSGHKAALGLGRAM